MIVNWDEFKAQSNDIDVCIVGGGAAGLTLANALAGTRLRVLVVEAGGLRRTDTSQDAFRGELANPRTHPGLHHFRVRAIGGASRIWGGRCVPFDPIDFERRSWAPGPGWPISLSDLDDYYRRAQIAAECGAFDYDPATALPGEQAELAPGLDGATIVTRLERFSRPTNFWSKFRTKLERDPNVHVLVDAPVVSVKLQSNAGAVDYLELKSPEGIAVQLRAKHFVIAAGGLETVRLLLSSDDVKSCGVGGDSGHLGHYYMSHLAGSAGQIIFTDPARVAFDYERDEEGIYVRRRLVLTPAAQRKVQCLNVAFRTHLPDLADPSHGDPIFSAMYLVKDLILYEYSRKLREHRPSGRQQLEHLANIARNPLALLAFSNRWIQKRLLAARKLPSVVLGSATGAYALEFHAEQSPNYDSRLTLINERDRSGMRRLRVDWRMNDVDTESLQRAYAVLASELERTGAGHLAYDPLDVSERARTEGAYGGHHIGAARMSESRGDGVVDTDCRVHGVANLYIASAAVFPTSSQANPTLTILALTLRIADRLKRELVAT